MANHWRVLLISNVFPSDGESDHRLESLVDEVFGEAEFFSQFTCKRFLNFRPNRSHLRLVSLDPIVLRSVASSVSESRKVNLKASIDHIRATSYDSWSISIRGHFCGVCHPCDQSSRPTNRQSKDGQAP